MSTRTVDVLVRVTRRATSDPDQPWQERGACYGMDDADVVFFPGKGVGAATLAKSICAGCPVRTECLAYAMRVEGSPSVSHRWGVYGGLTALERGKLAARGQAAPGPPGVDRATLSRPAQEPPTEGHPMPDFTVSREALASARNAAAARVIRDTVDDWYRRWLPDSPPALRQLPAPEVDSVYPLEDPVTFRFSDAQPARPLPGYQYVETVAVDPPRHGWRDTVPSDPAELLEWLLRLDDVRDLCGDEVPLVQQVIRWYKELSGNGVGGNLHIVLDDHNLDPHDLAWSEGYCAAEDDTPGRRLAQVLQRLGTVELVQAVTGA